VLGDLHRLGRRQFDNLALQGKLGVLQRVATIGASLEAVLDCLGGRLSAAGTVLLFGPFAPGFLLWVVFAFGFRRSIRPDERGRLALVLVQFLAQQSIRS
jgi:hypothetical protein